MEMPLAPTEMLLSSLSSTEYWVAMPVTFPAHQGLILAVKLRWPRHVDATALCIGAAAPDLAYPLGLWMNRQSHTALGLALWAVPFGVGAAVVTRRWAASGIFACLPDLGRFQLRSYRVLSARRPPLWQTLTSTLIGGASHILIDGFTHTGRWGADWLNLNGTAFTAPLRGTMTSARVLQYLGHTGGTLLFAALLLVIASSGRLVSWYGDEAVNEARSVRAPRRQRLGFAALVVAPTVVTLAIFDRTGIQSVFLAQTAFVPSLLAAGALIDRSLGTRPQATTSSNELHVTGLDITPHRE